MIKLKELLNLNELTYNDGPSEKHQRRMNYPITMFNEITIEEVPFPENTGKETLDELKYLASLEINPDFAKEHDDVEEVTMVEIDEMVVNASKEYLPSMSCAFKDPRLTLIIDDGIKYKCIG